MEFLRLGFILFVLLGVAQGLVRGNRNRHAPTFAPNFRLRPNPPVKIPIVGNDDTANGNGIPAWARNAFPPLDVGLPPGAKFNGQLNIPCATNCGDVPRQCQVRRKDICGRGCFCALSPSSAPSFSPTTTGYTFAPTVTGSTNLPTFAAPPPPPTPPTPPSPVAAPTPWWGAPLAPVSVPTVGSANQPTFLPYSGASWAGGTSQPTSFAPTRSPPTRKPSSRPSRRPTSPPTTSQPSISPTPQPTTQSPTTRPTFQPSSSVLASSTRSPTSSVKSSSSNGSRSTSSLSSGSLAGIIVGALLVFSAIVAMFCIRRSGDKEESLYNRWLSSQVEKLHPSDLAAGGNFQGEPGYLSDGDRLSAVVDFADAYGAPVNGRRNPDHSLERGAPSIGMGNHGMWPNRPGSLMMVPPGPGHRQSAAPGGFAPYFPPVDGPGLDPRRMSAGPPMRRPTAPGMIHGPGHYPPKAMFPPGPGPGPGGRPMTVTARRPQSPTSHDDL